MKITLTPEGLRPKTKKLKTPRRLPGEPRPFKERSLRNLVPAQHLDPDGRISSGRDHEVSKADPLMQRIKELEAEVAALRAQLEQQA